MVLLRANDLQEADSEIRTGSIILVTPSKVFSHTMAKLIAPP
jgi:hypothetical protein